MARPRLGRYSRAVRIFKIGLPLAALGLVSSIFLVTGDDFTAGFNFSAADFAALEDDLRLAHPRFTGMTERGEPYVVSAEWAQPDRPDPSEISLHGIRAEITLADGRVVTLSAADGDLRPRDQTVALKGSVVVTTSDGYRAETEAAQADIGGRVLTVPGPVRAEGPMGLIEAGAMRMTRGEGAEGQPPEEIVLFEKR
ncbi:MAG TPA: hypothetical protein VFR34_07380, partial [Paracoccaceae bacterium]|nr:hypothetical protein [Paracoccaceae bacterium]